MRSRNRITMCGSRVRQFRRCAKFRWCWALPSGECFDGGGRYGAASVVEGEGGATTVARGLCGVPEHYAGFGEKLLLRLPGAAATKTRCSVRGVCVHAA